MRAIRKEYGATVAVDDLDLKLIAGTVHAVVGENGAGKSTAAQIAAGVVRASRGHLELDAEPVTFGSARVAEAHGIVLIPQELQLYESLSVAENIYVGRSRPRYGPFVSRRVMRTRVFEQLRRLGVTIDPAQRIQQLNHGSRQLVAIARALLLDARVLIMDEPTAALDEWEAQRMLGVVAALRQSGVAVLYVSHRLSEVLQIADEITVMRDGVAVAHGPREGFDEASLAANMLGRPLARLDKRPTRARDEIALATVELSGAGFSSVDLEVRAGEVVGMAGLIGAGRSEFAQAVFGSRKVDSGTVRVGNRPVRIRSVRGAVRLGVGYVPEERQAQGLFPPLSCTDNVVMPALPRVRAWGLVSRSRESAYLGGVLDPLRIKGAMSDPVGRFSGGTQQKVLLGRWLALRPKVLILDEPTRGIDVGTRAEIYRIIDRLSEDGVAILLISADIQELLQLSDRVVVMRGGRLVAELAGAELTEMNVGSAALGTTAGGA
jgi:ABC-type sugar transport system ATPase subunit